MTLISEITNLPEAQLLELRDGTFLNKKLKTVLITTFNVALGRETVHSFLSIISEKGLYRTQTRKPISTAWTPLFWQ